MEKIINFIGFVNDEDVKDLYHKATGLVFPTLSEGFGLPGLEAMASETVVVCSKIPVLREIYEEAAIYFNPLEVKDIADKIIDCLSLKPEERKILINKGFRTSKKIFLEKNGKRNNFHI